jgi:hypothetical protein
MSRDQLHLRRTRKKPNEKVRWRALETFSPGTTKLKHGLGLDEAAIDKLRARAEALYHAGKWYECVEVLEGLGALGDVGPFDALMLSRAYDELGDPERASAYAKLAEEMLTVLDTLVREIRTGGAR